MTTQVQYKVGDLLLVNIGYLKEREIEQIAVKSKCMKIDGTWYEASDITPEIKQVLGHATYTKNLFGKKIRKVEYT